MTTNQPAGYTSGIRESLEANSNPWSSVPVLDRESFTDLAIEVNDAAEDAAAEDGWHAEAFASGALFALGYVLERLGIEVPK